MGETVKVLNEPAVGTDNTLVSPDRIPRASPRDRLRSILTSVAAFGVVALFAVAAMLVAQRVVDRDIENRVRLQSEAVVASILTGVELVDVRLVALDGLFRSSDLVTAEEYADFVAELEVTAGMGGMAYLPIVDAAGLATFEKGAAEMFPGYEVFEVDEGGNRVAVKNREVYFPVQFFEPADAFGRPLGLDAGSPPGRLPYLVKASAVDQTVATPLLPLATTGQEGFLLYRSTVDTDGTINAVVAAPVVLDDLIADRVPDGFTRIVEWTVRDVTEHVSGSAASTSLDPHIPILTPTGNGLVHTDVVRVFDRVWQFDLAPTAGSPALVNQSDPLWILLAGLIMAILVGVSVYAYTRRRDAVTEMTALKELLVAKDEFLATVSHELRTPLTGVLGFAELLRDQGAEYSADERAELAATIAEEASDVAGIIDDLLVIGRAEHGTLTVVAVPVDLCAQAAQVLETLELTDRICVETATPNTAAVADPGRVRQIIRNLVANAVAYGGPNIRIMIEPIGEQLAIEVIDDGDGVPPEHVEKIFDPYHRAHTNTGTPGSMGLGLTVSRTLAQRMGGALTHRRNGDNTIFRLTVPAAASRNTDEDPATADELGTARYVPAVGSVLGNRR
ncbi:MAG: ATP-binding protein [Acidimicrobiia bacterium]|nr:ATP-binding protein [Acidimicrobiia bacterium]